MKPAPRTSKKQTKNQVNKANTALRYTSIATEMILVMLAGVFGGIKLDNWLNTSPLFTALISVIAVFAGIYLAIKDFIKKDDKTK